MQEWNSKIKLFNENSYNFMLRDKIILLYLHNFILGKLCKAIEKYEIIC